MYKRVVVTGSLAFDHIMSMPGRFKDHILPDKLHILNVSFIMETFRQEFGGTAGNLAYSLGLLKTPNVIVGSVGHDFGPYKRHLSKIKEIDLSGIKEFSSNLTARGFVTTDRDDNQIWGFYNGAMRNSPTLSVRQFLGKESLLMIAPNDPNAMMKYVNEAVDLKTPYVFDPAFNIAHFGLRDLKKAVKNSQILIGNDYEVTLIKRKLKLSQDALLKSCSILITTLGSKGSLIQTRFKTIKIPAATPLNESDPTGAGDAYRAGLLAGYIRKFPLEICGKIGALSACYTVEKYGTQTHRFTLAQFAKRYAENFGERLKNFQVDI